MHLIGSARGFAVVLLLGGGVACAQSSLPATVPTVLPAPVAAPQVRVAPVADGARRAQVLYSDGKLEITADNSSLNQILHEISRETGMKITGGVTDERVFGKYGPGAPAEILIRLLDGTGSNMLLRETASKVPAELILTARQGGPTPPNPNARGFDDDEPSREYTPQPAPIPMVQPPAAPADAGGAGAGVGAEAGAGMSLPPGAPTRGGANPPSPNAAQTPQQIFEQLQQLQQTQPQQPANPQ